MDGDQIKENSVIDNVLLDQNGSIQELRETVIELKRKLKPVISEKPPMDGATGVGLSEPSESDKKIHNIIGRNNCEIRTVAKMVCEIISDLTI